MEKNHIPQLPLPLEIKEPFEASSAELIVLVLPSKKYDSSDKAFTSQATCI